MTSIDRTAYPRFERMSVRDVVDVFTPPAEEIVWAREKTTIDAHLLALAAWLESYQYLGYFPKLDQVPASALAHLCEALGLAEEVPCEAGRTLGEPSQGHQRDPLPAPDRGAVAGSA